MSIFRYRIGSCGRCGLLKFIKDRRCIPCHTWEKKNLFIEE